MIIFQSIHHHPRRCHYYSLHYDFAATNIFLKVSFVQNHYICVIIIIFGYLDCPQNSGNLCQKRTRPCCSRILAQLTPASDFPPTTCFPRQPITGEIYSGKLQSRTVIGRWLFVFCFKCTARDKLIGRLYYNSAQLNIYNLYNKIIKILSIY